MSIVRMRKMDLLLYHREQEKFLSDLRGLGVVHITSEQPVDSAATQGLSAEVQRAHRVASALKRVHKEAAHKKADKDSLASKVGAAPAALMQSGAGAALGLLIAATASVDYAVKYYKEKKRLGSAEELADAVDNLLKTFEECETKRDRIDQELVAVAKDRALLAPWGEFDPQGVKRLADLGIGIKFYDMSQKRFDALNKADLGVKVISIVRGVVHFAVVFRGDAPEVPGAEDIRLPDTSITALDNKAETLKIERAEVEAAIQQMIPSIEAIEEYRNEQFDGLKFEEARGAFESAAEGKLLKLTGWVPQKDEAKVSEFLKSHAAYATFRDPAEDETPPVKLKNGAFNRMFEPVIGMYSLPGYREIDVVPFIAPFFTVFYGLCLADAGYGGIILIAALVAMFKVSAKMRPLMALGAVLGFSTVVSGILNNSFFGQSVAAVAPYAPLAQMENGDYPVMSLSFVAAFMQLFLGMGIQSYMQMRDRGFAAGLQPISSIFMMAGAVIIGARDNVMNLGINTFAVGTLEIGPTLGAIGRMCPFGPFASGSVGEVLLYGGLAMLLLFNSLDKSIFLRPLTGLWALYNFATGMLSNVLSYMRLFALGLAGGLLGAAVNQIALMFIKTEVDGVVAYNVASLGMVATVIILIGGHALNFGLNGLGSFIHPLRLTFVEFYGAMGFNGGGKPYMPFAKVEK